jgi:hypothetical protein
VTATFLPGDRVTCRSPGSWVDGMTGTVERLDVTSSDEIRGHQVRILGHGVTVLPPEELEPVATPAGGGS